MFDMGSAEREGWRGRTALTAVWGVGREGQKAPGSPGGGSEAAQGRGDGAEGSLIPTCIDLYSSEV